MRQLRAPVHLAIRRLVEVVSARVRYLRSGDDPSAWPSSLRFSTGSSALTEAVRRRPGQGTERHRVPEDGRAEDFYFGAPDYEWPVGNIQMIGKSNAEAMRGEEPTLTKLAPHFSLAEVAKHALDSWPTTEDLPRPENRVTVDDAGHVHLAYRSTNDQEADRLYDELDQILNHVGLAQHHVLDKNFYMHMDISVAAVAHQAGTCRFGTDPATSVLDVNCKAHELDNLYVVDTVFPSIGAVNPALTAMANAIRVGEHPTELLR
jgi:choline dehydrogenase-like flavoprotein